MTVREPRYNFTQSTQTAPGSDNAAAALLRLPRRNDRNANPAFTYSTFAIKPPGKS